MADPRDNDRTLSPIKLTARGTAVQKPGAVNLRGFPRLVYAPTQHGPGIRTEDNGTAVTDICTAFAERPDAEAVARRFGTTPDHVREAVRYATEAGFAEPAAGAGGGT